MDSSFSKRSWKSKENSSLLSSKNFQNDYVNKLDINFLKRAFLNRPILRQTKLCHHPSRPTTTHHNPPRPNTTHHDPPPAKIYPPPHTTSQNISTTTHYHPPPSTTTHHQPKYIHHHPPPAKIYPPLPTISQKMDHHPAKAKIYSYIYPLDIALTVSFSSKCNIPFRDGDFV